jgi:hypothetical protein
MSLQYPKEFVVDVDSPFDGMVLEQIISEEDLEKRVQELGRAITQRYRDKTPILIAVLNGSFISVESVSGQPHDLDDLLVCESTLSHRVLRVFL